MVSVLLITKPSNNKKRLLKLRRFSNIAMVLTTSLFDFMFDFITADKVFRNEINRTNDMTKQCPFQYNR